jgi:hypothetical protein
VGFGFTLPSTSQNVFMHKLAYAEFSQDEGRLLKFVKHFRKLSEQLNAMGKQKYEIKYSISKLNKYRQ